MQEWLRGQAERVAWKKGSEAGYGNIGFHPNGRDIAVVAFDGKLQVWDWNSTTKRAETQAHDQIAMALAYSPDGSRIASGSNDHTLCIYDSELKEQLHKLQATASVFSIAFSPDGSRIMGACAENQALIGRPAVTMWDTASGKEVFSSIGEGGLIRASRFTRDGTRFITGNPAVTLDGVFAPGETETFNAFPTDPKAYGGVITHDSIAAYAKNYWQERVALSDKSVEPQIVNRDQRAWPRRDPATPADAIDLTPHYNAKLDVDWIIDLQFNQGANANDLATLPQGLVYLGNVPFDVRGVIQTRTRKLSDHFPTEVRGIAVGRKAQRIHVLHATMYKPTNNARIAYYYINYANGTRDQMPIVYGRDIMDWHHVAGQQFEADKATIAWTGTNEQTKSTGRTLRLFKTVITPRQPDQVIDSIDFVSTRTDSSPFLIAATIDRNADPMAMYLESNSRAVTNYTSNRDSREFKSELIASWKHLAAEATREQPSNRELARAYTQLAITLETSLRDTIQPVATNPFSSDRITNALADQQWRYWDKGGLPADNWHQPDYDDSSWPAGDAPLGYGEPTGLATEVGFGGKAGKKHATTFFRKTFTIEISRQLYRISVSVDDGAAVYLNGNRIATINMPKDFDHTSLAKKINPEPITPEAYWIPSSKLNPGENTLAIEVHQVSRTSSDITCDVKLEAIDTTVDYEGIEATLRKNNRSLPPGLRDR